MSERDLNWKYVDELVQEGEVISRARQQSLELGIQPVSPALGAQLAVIAGAARARSIIEIGTGAGVSGLWLLRGAPTATLTSIDEESDHLQEARTHFSEAGIPQARVRLIAGRAAEVLPRMNEDSYDIVFVDGDAASVIEYVEHALRLVKPGGVVLVAHALWRGRVADPAKRDDNASDFRSLLTEIASSNAVISTVSPAGDGLLQILTLPA